MKRRNLFGQPVTEDPSKGSGVKGRKKPAGKEKTEANSKYPLSDTANRDATKGRGFDNQTRMRRRRKTIRLRRIYLDSQAQGVET